MSRYVKSVALDRAHVIFLHGGGLRESGKRGKMRRASQMRVIPALLEIKEERKNRFSGLKNTEEEKEGGRGDEG